MNALSRLTERVKSLSIFSLCRHGPVACSGGSRGGRTFHRLLQRSFSLRGGSGACSVPWRNSHALPDLSSIALCRFHRRRNYRMRSTPMQHHSFLRKEKIPDKVSAASGDDAAPILSVLLEPVSLKWIDPIAYDARDSHWCPLSGRIGRCIAVRQRLASPRCRK
jgi:hypothetical protein